MGLTQTDEDELDDCDDTNPTCFFGKLSHVVKCDNAVYCSGGLMSRVGMRATLYTFALNVPEERK